MEEKLDNYDETDECYDGPVIRLSKALDVQSLRDGEDGVEFEIDESETGENFHQYDPSDVYKYYRDEILCEENEIEENDMVTSKFQRLISQMENVTADGGVMKKIITEGVGEKVYPRAHVTIHYNSYLEHGDEPFDSSRLRGRPLSFDLAEAGEMSLEVLPGFNHAVGSMKKNEVSYFYFHPGYFMRNGCPPRIPPNAHTIHVIELISFSERGSSEYFSLPQSERMYAPFELAMSAARKAKADGKVFYDRKDYRQANRAYRRSLKILDDHHLQNEEEEKLANEMKMTLYRNLCVVNLNLPDQHGMDVVIKFASIGLQLDHKNDRLCFYRAKAYFMKGLDDAARKDVIRSKQLSPGYQKEKSELLAKIEMRIKLMKSEEKLMYGRMFKSDSNANNSNKNNSSNNNNSRCITYKPEDALVSHKPGPSGDNASSAAEEKFPDDLINFYTEKLSEFKMSESGSDDLVMSENLLSKQDISCMKHVAKQLSLVLRQTSNESVFLLISRFSVKGLPIKCRISSLDDEMDVKFD